MGVALVPTTSPAGICLKVPRDASHSSCSRGALPTVRCEARRSTRSAWVTWVSFRQGYGSIQAAASVRSATCGIVAGKES